MTRLKSPRPVAPDGAPQVSRRSVLKVGALAGAGAAFLGGVPGFGRIAEAQARSGEIGDAYVLNDPARQLYSVCLQCNTGCGIKVKLLDGVAVKIDGNPYHPMTMYPHIPYETPITDAGNIDGAICPKGQSGLQSVYDPYRLVSVLKRKPGTKRGANDWVTVDFATAITEIVEGGDLFGEGPVPGLRESYALTDAAVAKEMQAAVKAIVDEKDPDAKRTLVEAFKTTFAAHLDAMIDPDHPDLGPRNNHLVFAWGRLKDARKDLIARFLGAYGTTNAHGHTTVCQGSLYFTGKAMSEQYLDGKWQGGQKFYWQGDIGNTKFAIFVGANIYEGNYGPPLRSPRLTQNHVDNGMRFVVVDPRFSKTAARAWKWLPAKPGSEGALALAMIAWAIDNGRINTGYLEAANEAAARAAGESTWTEATWLVKLDEDGLPGRFLRASEIGLAEKEVRPQVADPEKTYEFDYFVALTPAGLVPVDPYEQDPAKAVRGTLLVDNLTLNGIAVKSALQVISDAAHEQTLDGWAEICGLDPNDIAEVSAEFTAHGRQAVADIHRGVSQHTNGFYNALAWYTLNALLGNYDHEGGLVKASTYKADGSKKGQPFDLKQANGTMAPFGLSVIRHGEKYDKSTLFLRDGYPAKRNWYPLSSDVYQEIVPSIGDAYPYPAKALIWYMGSPIYSLPAGHTNIPILADPSKVPLFIAVDAFIGETSMYADYIFPDQMYLERWEFHGSQASVPQKIQPVRNPAIDPLVPDVQVFGRDVPLSLEAFLLGVAEKLELPGFGAGGFGEYGDLGHPDDLYIRMVANLAFGEKADGSDGVPDADDEELRIFTSVRSHLRPSVYDAARWEQLAGPMWRKVVYTLNRGGRFEAYSKGYTEGVFPEASASFFGANLTQIAHPFGAMVNIYGEKTYDTKSAMTGEHLAGHARYVPAGLNILGEPLPDEQNGYDLTLITYREIMQTKSRTSSNYWLLALRPENFVLISTADARERGLEDGDVVRITSASNVDGVWDLLNGRQVPMDGTVRTTEGIRPGVVAFSLGFGHWAYGGVDFTVDGTTVRGDRHRIRGIHANAAMRVDPYLGNTTLVDPVGGSAVFYDTKVKLVKV